MQTKDQLILPALSAGISIVLFLAVFHNRMHHPATGYLHSWNQVTTLALIRQIDENWKTFTRPTDVVTRVVWSNNSKSVDPNDRYQSFVVFEEFPLFHLISARVSRLTGSLESGGRTTAVAFWLIAAAGLHQLAVRSANKQVAAFTMALFLSSFPVLYYGQAIMSDIAMTAAAIWGVNFLANYILSKHGRCLPLAATSFAIAGLFKSYGITLVVCFIHLYFSRQKLGLPNFSRAKVLGLVLITVLPTLSWHLFALTQGGVQEFASHHLSDKITALGDFKFYQHMVKIWFRYLGYLPGALIIIALFLKTSELGGSHNNKTLALWWPRAWILSSLPYILLTADKLMHHDYYFLLVFPPFFFLGGRVLSELFNRLFKRSYIGGVVSVILILSVNIAAAHRHLLKATTPNPDVLLCAELVNSITNKDDLIATLTDVSRYNSIAFYSGRRAINIEASAFPISRYRNAGARYLVVNLPPEQHRRYKETLLQNLDPIKIAHFTDFRKKPRECALYSVITP